jgi:hypothetical protein
MVKKQMPDSICYVTAYLDIKRETWNTFSRDFSSYLKSLKTFLEVYKAVSRKGNELVIYIDECRYEQICEYIKDIDTLTVVKINEKSLRSISKLWSRLERETEIIESEEYKNLLKHRLQYPEHNNPKYTLINHAKIDMTAYSTTISNCDYFCWIDFGYFEKTEIMHKRLVNIDKISKDTINYTLINNLTVLDKDLYYTLFYAPERVGGYFFIGNREKILEYQKLYHEVHEDFQKRNLADDDQHLALRCFFSNPKLFTLYNLGGWHRALLFFSRN